MPHFKLWPGREPTKEFGSDHYALAECAAPRWWPTGSKESKGGYEEIAATITDGTLDDCVAYELFPKTDVRDSVSHDPDSMHPSHSMTEQQPKIKLVQQKIMKNDAYYNDVTRITCYVSNTRKRSAAGEYRRRLSKGDRKHFDTHVDNRWPQRHDCDRDCGSYRRGNERRGGGSSGRDGARKGRGRGNNGSTRSIGSNRSNRVTEVNDSIRNGASKVRLGGRVRDTRAKAKPLPRRDGGKGHANKRSRRLRV